MKYPITAKRLTEAMAQKGIKAQELADRSGVSKSSISQYINGSHSPSNISAGKMAAVLEVNPVWLMGFDVPMDESDPAGYYDSPIARAYAEFLANNPAYQVLFDAARDVRPEDIDFVRQMIERMTDKND